MSSEFRDYLILILPYYYHISFMSSVYKVYKVCKVYKVHKVESLPCEIILRGKITLLNKISDFLLQKQNI